MTQPLPGPEPIKWMDRPAAIPGCPPGLEYLTKVDFLSIEQKVSLMEAFTGWRPNNKYGVKNNQGQLIYYAFEDTNTCMRICCKFSRGFTIHIVDSSNQAVMKMSREFRCCSGCCWCAGSCKGCAYEVQVEAPVGTVVGYVRQMGTFWKPKYDILDENRNSVLKVVGPCCVCDGPCCSCGSEFLIMSADEQTQIGKLNKIYGGFVKELFTMADNFSINFPIDLSVKTKATLMGAQFLVDFMFFENDGDD